MKTSLKLTLLLASLSLSTHSLAQGTMDLTKHHTWCANTGWINWQATGATGAGAYTVDSYLFGKIWSANCGWITLGDGTPANGWHYANITGEDSGVNLNPDGTLTGLAWGANIGWINFEQTTGKPKLNYATGTFSGYAWSANCGWINLGDSRLQTIKIFCPDSDNDGMSDPWELQNFPNLTTANATTDQDGDGKKDVEEFNSGSNPNDAHSFLTITNINVDNTEVYLSVKGLSTDRLYTLETTTDLLTWSPLISPTLGIGATATFDSTVDPAEKRRYWRIRAQKPLP